MVLRGRCLSRVLFVGRHKYLMVQAVFGIYAPCAEGRG
jgi:hypothetical protein